MIGIVIVAHGGLAREYLSAVEHVVGPQTGIKAVMIEENHDRGEKQAEICAAADGVDSQIDRNTIGNHARSGLDSIDVDSQSMCNA